MKIEQKQRYNQRWDIYSYIPKTLVFYAFSKRVPGKKNPVPVDTYIGRITPEGVVRGNKKKVDTNDSDIIVKEYGVEWKELQALSTIYLVSFSGKKAISRISEDQKKILDRIGLEMVVD